MRAGSLHSRVELQRLTGTPDGQGGDTNTQWVTIEKTWASIMPLGANERYFAGKTYARATHKIEVRHLPAMKAKDRFLFNGRALHIQGFNNVGERSVRQVVYCEEKI